MKGLKERDYNAIRIDTALNWCFHKDGSPRGKVAIRATVPGYSHRFRVISHQGSNSVEIPVWWANQKWLKETNNRFLKGIVKGN